MAVRIGHASIDERGKAKNGAAGDNNGREVYIRNWYAHPKKWVVLRCKDPVKRELIAKAMERACKNNDIGYDQYQRDTLFNNVKNKGFDPAKTTKKVETDCSALVRVCIAYAYGKDIAGNIRTVTEPSTLVKTGEFEKLTSDKYCKSSDWLLRGDIVCTSVSGHTAVVLDDGAKVVKESPNAADKKSVDEVAREVIDGKWGAGVSRKEKLEAYGYDYKEVQKRVNEILNPKKEEEESIYYPKYTGKLGTLDAILKAVGVPDKFRGNWSKRKPLAMANGINNYTGKSFQNAKLIALAIAGKLKKVV
jgi:hypothetical protein